MTAVLGTDWGFCHTAERNLGKVAELAAAEPVPGAGHDVAAQAGAIQAAIEAAPKSRSWRLRSRIGERVKWYETPEEVPLGVSAPAGPEVPGQGGPAAVPGPGGHPSRPV